MSGSWTTGHTVEEGVLEGEYQSLQPLIEQVHPHRHNRLNTAEFVRDVPGEMERGDINSDEDLSDATTS